LRKYFKRVSLALVNHFQVSQTFQMKAVLKSLPPAKSPEEVEIDRVLGDRALFDVTDPQKFGGPSPPVIYRARRAGMIELVDVGGRTKISRATMKRLLLEGLGRVDFYYPNSKPKGVA
jgi:hypothetical protein